jgi:hypothetical protein
VDRLWLVGGIGAQRAKAGLVGGVVRLTRHGIVSALPVLANSLGFLFGPHCPAENRMRQTASIIKQRSGLMVECFGHTPRLNIEVLRNIALMKFRVPLHKLADFSC